MRFPDSRILIFAKAPEPGQVKTRLLPVLSAAEAAGLYSHLLESTIKRLARAELAPIQCWCAPTDDHPLFRRLSLAHRISLHIQVGPDLGGRMEHAARQALDKAESVLLIGGDCPVLGPGHLEQALTWLASGEDAVLGPAEDGGYVLFGLRRTDPILFSDIEWGGEDVLAMTRARLGGLGWTWRELETLWDLDRPQDLDRYCE